MNLLIKKCKDKKKKILRIEVNSEKVTSSIFLKREFLKTH